jgi:hypothetical protein
MMLAMKHQSSAQAMKDQSSISRFDSQRQEEEQGAVQKLVMFICVQ